MAMMAPLLVGTAATGTAAATAGLIGAAGSVTAMGALSAASTVLGLAGSFSQASNMRKAAADNAASMQAAAAANKVQTDYAAGQELAAGQHEADKKRHQAALMLSRAQAVAASSGGGALDETLMNGIVGSGEQDAGYSIYSSTEKAKGLQYRGAVGMADAANRSRAMINDANRSADATIIGGIAKAGMSIGSRFMPGPAPGVSASNYQIGTPGYSGNYLEWDA